MIARLFVIIVAPPIIAYAFAATFITESRLAVKLAWLSAGSESAAPSALGKQNP